MVKKGTICVDGHVVVRLRENKGFSQRELADEAGVHHSVVERMENGKPVRPRLADSVAQTLGASLEELRVHEVLSTTAPHEAVEVSDSVASALPPCPHVFVGREEEAAHLKNHLGVGTGAHASAVHILAAVRGWPGIGKTALATILVHDLEVQATFTDGILWGALGNTPNILSVMALWGRVLDSPELLSMGGLRQATILLTSLLHKRRSLLVLDDVWESAHVLPFQQACGPHCSILITTRLPGVINSLAQTSQAACTNLPPLTPQQSLALLQQIVPRIVARHRVVCERLVHDLGGLPLALHVAGHLLREEAHLGWGVQELLEELRGGEPLLTALAPPDRFEWERQTIPTVAALLQRSITHLDEAARNAFMRLGSFEPKPNTFDLEALQAVWDVSDPKPMVRHLTARGLLEPVGEGRFQMHALLTTYARSLLEEYYGN